MMRLVHHIGIETFIADLAAAIEEDFAKWDQAIKRHASGRIPMSG